MCSLCKFHLVWMPQRLPNSHTVFIWFCLFSVWVRLFFPIWIKLSMKNSSKIILFSKFSVWRIQAKWFYLVNSYEQADLLLHTKLIWSYWVLFLCQCQNNFAYFYLFFFCFWPLYLPSLINFDYMEKRFSGIKY